MKQSFQIFHTVKIKN